MRLKSAVVLSFLLHLLIIFLLTRILPPPVREDGARSPLSARIVYPPEAERPEPWAGASKAEPSREALEAPPAAEAPPPVVPPPPAGTPPRSPQPEALLRPPAGPPAGEALGEGVERLPGARELFDPGIIGDIARLDRKPAPEQGKESGITFSTGDLKYYSYMMKLKSKIERVWRYPPEALRRGIYGDPYIRFTIKKDGYLGSVELIRTSGYRELDEAAMKALRDAEPYWPLPESWGKEGLTITGHFVYSIYGAYLR
ncbi:MAG TPA: TonB family protein [Nitrospirae bacterium]|nr:TonB family protein [Nitrospirota bacterium]